MKQVTASLSDELARDLDCLRRASMNPPIAGILRVALREFIDKCVRENVDVGQRYALLRKAERVKHLLVVK